VIADVVVVGITVSTIVSMVIGVGIPALAAFITREGLPPRLKILVLLFLSTATGVVSAVITELPTTSAGWWHLVLTVLMTYATAAVSQVQAWVPSGATKAIHRSSDRFIGFGPESQPEHAKAA
jgi:hypothetical protein